MATARSAEEFSGLVGWVVDVIATLGPPGVAFLLALDNIVPVIPSEVVLPFAGYLAAQGEMSFVVAFVAATFGSTASAYVLYEVGRRLGPQRARAFLYRIPLTDEDDIERATDWFDRHGTLAVFTGRFVPLVRSLVSIPAGTQGMGRIRFGVLTTLGSGAWNAIWLWIGYVVGTQWEQVGHYSSWLNYGLGAFLLIVVGRYVWQRRERLPWVG